MPLSNEDAITIADLVKDVVAKEQEELTNEFREVIAGLSKQVDEIAQGLQQFVVERTTGIDNEVMTEVMVGRFDEFWNRAIAANYAASKKK